MKKLFSLIFLVLALAGCAEISIWMIKKKPPIYSNDPLSKHAQAFFWKTFHGNRVRDIPQAEKQLMQAYLKNSNDPILVSYIAFLHIWKLTERDFIHPNPLIVNEIALAQTYFTKAHELSPSNPIYHGFLGDTYLFSGQIFNDEKAQVKGYFLLKDAIAEWPEFNYFTAGYPMSTLKPSDPHFKEGLEWQWKTLDLCAGQKINRQHPDFSPYMRNETTVGKKRACWNSWSAPHNFEGFFMNMGDMLVKSGDWKTAIAIYNNAKLSKTYHTWPYRQMLEQRIVEAKKNLTYFNETHPAAHRAIMFNSGHGCMACHQKS
jgi:hypothetical protein